MTGFLIGLVCGAGELYLLTQVTKAVSSGQSFKTLAIVFAKILLFAAAFVPVALYFSARSHLVRRWNLIRSRHRCVCHQRAQA